MDYLLYKLSHHQKNSPIRSLLREAIQKDTTPEVWQKAIIQDKELHSEIMKLEAESVEEKK